METNHDHEYFHDDCGLCQMEKENVVMSGSEAIYGFCAWLTCQDVETIMSAHHDAAIICDRIKTFCETNNLPDPREEWTDILTHPKEIRK